LREVWRRLLSIAERFEPLLRRFEPLLRRVEALPWPGRLARTIALALVPTFVAGLLIGHLTGDAVTSAATGGQSSTGSYRFSTGFSGIQGANQWYYLQWDGTRYSEMAWDPGAGEWQGGYRDCQIGPGWAHPDTNQAVIGWKAPRSGSVTVQGFMDNRMYTSASDGVRAVVKQQHGSGTTKVWPSAEYQVIQPNFMAQHVFKVDVQAGDMLYFQVDQFGTSAYDTLFWDPEIAYDVEPKFVVDQAEVVMTPDDFQRMGVSLAYDSMLSVVPDGDNQFDFYHSQGGGSQGTVVSKFRGTLAEPAQTPVYTKNALNSRAGEQWWIANVFQTDDHALLAFCHIENGDPARNGWWGIGLAYSTDNGASFHRLGWIVGQHVKDDVGATNIGGVPFVAKDGYFYIYYGDVTTAGAAPEPSVARAPIADVLDAARRGTVTPWRKYRGGGWEEPGLNGNASPVMPNGPLYSTHGDGAYSTYLGRYLMTGYTHGPGRGVYITFSPDAVNYDVPAWLQRSSMPDKDSLSPFETIVNVDGTDNGIVGQSFYIYYGYRFRQADVTTSDYPPLFRWLFRQKVTLNAAGFSARAPRQPGS
jgi:hypothetical protein